MPIEVNFSPLFTKNYPGKEVDVKQQLLEQFLKNNSDINKCNNALKCAAECTGSTVPVTFAVKHENGAGLISINEDDFVDINTCDISGKPLHWRVPELMTQFGNNLERLGNNILYSVSILGINATLSSSTNVKVSIPNNEFGNFKFVSRKIGQINYIGAIHGSYSYERLISKFIVNVPKSATCFFMYGPKGELLEIEVKNLVDPPGPAAPTWEQFNDG